MIRCVCIPSKKKALGLLSKLFIDVNCSLPLLVNNYIISPQPYYVEQLHNKTVEPYKDFGRSLNSMDCFLATKQKPTIEFFMLAWLSASMVRN